MFNRQAHPIDRKPAREEPSTIRAPSSAHL